MFNAACYPVHGRMAGTQFLLMQIVLVFVLLVALLPMLAPAQPSRLSKVVYHCTTQLSKGPVHDGRNTLYFNAEKGLFVHENYPKEDEYIDKGTVVAYIKGDPEGLPVFINLKERYLYYKSEWSAPPGEIFIFRENLPEIDWQIGREQKTIGDFTCVKAVGEFGGRTYDVWFTPEIPVGLGPYKLCGLPGLILAAESRDGRVKYAFRGYESPVADAPPLAKPTQGIYISWEEFKTYVINRLLKVEAMSKPDLTATNDDPPADYEIERNKFTIISEYKSKREKQRHD
jgi:GLPGLI family protein